MSSKKKRQEDAPESDQPEEESRDYIVLTDKAIIGDTMYDISKHARERVVSLPVSVAERHRQHGVALSEVLENDPRLADEAGPGGPVPVED